MMDNYFSRVSRKLSSARFASGFYFLWLLLTILIFGLFGILPSARNLSRKIIIAKEMQEVNIALEKKISFLQSVDPLVEEAEKYMPYLDVYLPTVFNVQDYLIDIVLAVSKGGYNVESFVPSVEGPGELGFILRLEGRGDSVILLKNIEELKRITDVQEIIYSLESEDEEEELDEVEVAFKIFSLEHYK